MQSADLFLFWQRCGTVTECVKLGLHCGVWYFKGYAFALVKVKLNGKCITCLRHQIKLLTIENTGI